MMGWFKKLTGVSSRKWTGLGAIEKTTANTYGGTSKLWGATGEGKITGNPWGSDKPSGPDGTPATAVDKGPVSALMTAEENTNEAMKRLFRMGVYVAPMFGGEQSALASTKLFGN